MISDQLDALYRARGRALLGYAYRLTGHRQDAEDLLQETLARCARAWANNLPDEPEAYVRGALAKAAINRWRLLQRAASAHTELEDREPFTPSDDRLQIWQALQSLSPSQRAVLVLRYYEDLSETEIAKVLGLRPGTVKSQAHRGLSQLRVLINAQQETTQGVHHG